MDADTRIAELEVEASRLAADRSQWRTRYYEESRTYWDAELPPGGACCAVCYQPVASEPCAEHHPATVAARLQARVAELESTLAERDVQIAYLLAAEPTLDDDQPGAPE